MLDLVELDRSLKLKAMARLSDSNHPFLSKVKDNLDLTDFFHPSANLIEDKVSVAGIKALRELRASYIGEECLASSRL